MASAARGRVDAPAGLFGWIGFSHFPLDAVPEALFEAVVHAGEWIFVLSLFEPFRRTSKKKNPQMF